MIRTPPGLTESQDEDPEADEQHARGLGATLDDDQRLGPLAARLRKKSGKAKRAKQKPPQPVERELTIVHKAGFKLESTLELHTKRSGKADKHEPKVITLNPLLKQNLDALCTELFKRKLVTDNIVYSQGVRDPKDAHKWSTAYNIATYLGKDTPKGKQIKERLDDLKDGVDVDGNVWISKDWKEDRIIANARAILVKHGITGMAAEGYPNWCPRHLPNIPTGLSKHLAGEAIDASIQWIDGWGPRGHKETDELISSFDLIRPVKGEKWHFQLKKNLERVFDFTGEELDFELEFDLTTDADAPQMRILPRRTAR